ncbi:MAG: aminotransferase class I/II-fold pyridoxal phosphate-dependent enzyme [bacterium]
MSDSKSSPNRVAEHVRALPRSGIRDFFDIVSEMDDVISLGIGEPDFVTPWTIREATIHALERGFCNYTSNLGMMDLRETICAHAETLFSTSYDPTNECIITVGVSEALDLALRALLNPGEEVVYHEPCYVSYAPSIAMTHAVPVPVVTSEADQFCLDPAALEEKITPRTRVLLLNFPCNPTGADLSAEQKRHIAQLAIDNDLIVLTDEIYTELTYGERSDCIASLPGMRERTIILHGFSKSYAMTGYRIGYACGPSELIEAMMKIHQYSMLCASSIGQAAALEALRNANDEMLRMKQEYQERRNVIVKRLNNLGMACAMPKGAFYVFPRIPNLGMSADAFARALLKEQSVAVVPGTAFGRCGEGFVRCSYATALDEIEIAMARIGTFIHTHS